MVVDFAGDGCMRGFLGRDDRVAEATQPTNFYSGNLRIGVCLRQCGWVRDNARWMNGFPFSLEAPGWFAVACGLALVAGVLALVRRPAVHGVTLLACAVGMVLLALAAGGLTWHRAASADVAVMVDLSASTRGAG